MNVITDWGSVLAASFSEIWFKLAGLTPNFLGAVLILIIGLLLAKTLGRLTAQIAKGLYVDRAVEATGIKKILEKIGFKLPVSRALGLLLAWFLYAIILVAVADILRLAQISEFLSAVVLYIPNVIIAVVILLVGIVISNFSHTLVKETALAANLAAGAFLATAAKWAILIFTFMAALIQLKVATELIQILFAGLILMVSLAGGIAFGLGGKDKAREVIEKITQK